jgi:hypothetical protein
MAGPTAPEIFSTLRQRELISAFEYSSLRQNYQHFVSEVSPNRAQYATKWVATVSGRIYQGDSYRDLIERIRGISNFQYAYIEQID